MDWSHDHVSRCGLAEGNFIVGWSHGDLVSGRGLGGCGTTGQVTSTRAAGEVKG